MCLASSFEREEGIILSRFLLRVKKEAIDDDGEKQREQCDRSVLCTLLSGVRERKRRVMMMRKSRFRAASSYYFLQNLEYPSHVIFFSSSSLSLSRENKSARALKRERKRASELIFTNRASRYKGRRSSRFPSPFSVSLFVVRAREEEEPVVARWMH